MVSVRRAVEEDELRALRDLIVPGLGNRRILRILLTNACRYSCDDCPMRAGREVPRNALEPIRLARLFMTAFRRGWCDGLFLSSGNPKDALTAMDEMLELVELLRVTHGYRGYLHVKALTGAQPGQIEKLVRLVDRVSYKLEPSCQRALDAHEPEKSLHESDRDLLSFAEGLEKKKLIHRRLYEADHLLRRYGFRADELPYGEDGHLPLDQDPKLAWALRHPERFPVELTTASREELQRVPGFGPRAVERILLVRGGETLRDLGDLRRFGVRVGRCGGFVALRGRVLGTRVAQAPLFSLATNSPSKTYEPRPGPLR